MFLCGRNAEHSEAQEKASVDQAETKTIVG